MQEKKLTIKQSILWNTWGSVIYLGVQWLQTILVARLLGYEDAGVFSLAMSVTNIFYGLSLYGMKNFQISDMDGKYSTGTYVLSRIITSIGSFLLCTCFVIFNQYDFKQSLSIVVYMIFKISEAIFDVFSGVYQKQWRMDYLGKSMAIRAVLMLCIFPTVIVVTKNLLLAVLIMTITVFLVIIFYDLKKTQTLEIIRLDIKSKQVMVLLIECIPLAIYGILSTSIAPIPRYFLEIYKGNEQLGIYASVAAPTLIVQMASTYIFNPMVTVFSESLNRKDKNRFIKTLLQCVKAIGCVAVVGVIGGKIFGRLGLRILYGESILDYEYLLTPLILCTVTTACVWLFCGILTVTRNFKSLLIGNGCAVLLAIFLSIVLIPLLGMQGATYVLLLSNLMGMVVFVYYIKKDIQEKFKSEN